MMTMDRNVFKWNEYKDIYFTSTIDENHNYDRKITIKPNPSQEFIDYFLYFLKRTHRKIERWDFSKEVIIWIK